MSEKIYALLLRLFPSHFRERYGAEALQLFRDRIHHETGLFPRLRLWFDLFTDLALSLPREYRYAQASLAPAAPAAALPAGLSPSFFVLAEKSPRPGALAIGGILSVSAILAFSALSRVSTHKPRRDASRETYRARSAPSSSYTQRAPQDASAPPAPGAASQSAAARSSAGETAGAKSPSAPGTSQSSMLPFDNDSNSSEAVSEPRDNGNVRRVPGASKSVLAAAHHRTVAAAIANLNRYYVDRALALQMSAALEAHEKNGDNDAAATGAAFAAQLTKQMRDVSHDLHVDLIYSEEPLPDPVAAPSSAELARYRAAMEQSNCTFEKVALLPHNIGYLKLNSFPDRAVCESTAKAAMGELNNADAIIFDLRDNRGGEPAMVMLLAAYLFDHPEYMYNPRENTSPRSWTQSPVPGNKLADKSVYVLTSRSTWSAAEHFSYDLKMLKRATIVGETTGGAAHSGVFHRLDEHFGMGIPEAKPINPFSDADWAVVGVAPDVSVPAEQALHTALQLAQRQVRK